MCIGPIGGRRRHAERSDPRNVLQLTKTTRMISFEVFAAPDRGRLSRTRPCPLPLDEKREVELWRLASFDVLQAVPSPTHLFLRYESFAVILIRPLSLAPSVESDYYLPRHGLCQEGAAVKRSYDISRIIALTRWKGSDCLSIVFCQRSTVAVGDEPCTKKNPPVLHPTHVSHSNQREHL